MEVFLSGLPERTTEGQLGKFLRPMLQSLPCQDYICQKKRSKTFATITFLRHSDGDKFLRAYGPSARAQLSLRGKQIQCRPSKHAPNELALRSIAMDANGRKSHSAEQAPNANKDAANENLPLDCSQVSCGLWTYVDSNPTFKSYYDCNTQGKMSFGPNAVTIRLISHQYIEIRNSTVQGIVMQTVPTTCLIFTLIETPHFFRDLGASLIPDLSEHSSLLNRFIEMLSVVSSDASTGLSRARVTGLSNDHGKMAGSCLVYRIELSNATTEQLRKAQKRCLGVPQSIRCSIDVHISQTRFNMEMGKLLDSFSGPDSTLPFGVAFQVQKLAQNCFLPPNLVLALLPKIRNILKSFNAYVCTQAIRKLFSQIPYPGPDTDAKELERHTIEETLNENVKRLQRRGLSSAESESLPGMTIIHRVTVTPAGTYLEGPEPESNNRVLRKYAGHHEHFLRVIFCDEDGCQVRYTPGVSNKIIFVGRFQKVLNEGIHIGGRRFAFLGFSHSSLRTQSCWFMAPFVFQGRLLFDRMLIRNLGDFTEIRCPAKCAARIGQTFSDTPTAVAIAPEVSKTIKEVERSRRVFSDGVGTVSMSTLEQIQGLLSQAKRKTTLLQIRFKGAKGMIALDSRLKGHSLNLRKSMIKFPGSDSNEVEICGTAHQPLPLYLNQQNIKILEDMGVSDEFFLSLQKKEVERLRQVTSSPSSASTFLKAHAIGIEFQLPWLLRKLHHLDLKFQDDSFLRDVVEVAVLIDLRTLKYKARIPVKDGYTLHGIMDETGVVKEGEVFCIVDENEKAKVIAGKNLVVTRSPALHPGDVQLVTGITVPESSPLMQLRNCICFSQWGDRDLPSQLSGGDLDGDLYHIVFDRNMRPKRTFSPADYEVRSPIDVGRPIEREDMTEFFVTFMETDQLGRIATLHKVLADQRADGVLDPDCIKLAELHSTAVDFSKTGIPIDIQEIPRGNRYRPDFMAPGPHIVVEKHKPTFLEMQSRRQSEEDDDDEGNGSPSYKYYESNKVLGKLYRNIDEHEFIASMQGYTLMDSANSNTNMQEHYPVSMVLKHIRSLVRQRCRLIQWKHHLDRARGIQEEYEDCILNIMTEYSNHPARPLTELEVFVGNILGRNSAQSKRQHELCISMKQRFDQDVAYIVDCIKTDGTNSDSERLERSIACFEAALEPRSRDRRHDMELVSFRYVAAAICLKEIDGAFH